MPRQRVSALWNPPEWTVWVVLGVFMVVHVSVLLSFVWDSVDSETFYAYCNATEVGTHVFAVPSLLSANVQGVREVITLSLVVSVVYHTLENYGEQQDALLTWHLLDRSTATGLIATVFLKYLAHINHGDAILILLVGLSSSMPGGGNMIAAGLVALLFMLALLNRGTQGLLQNAFSWGVSLLSLGATPSKPDTVVFKDVERGRVIVAFILNVFAVAAFLIADMSDTYDQWFHSVWHALVYLVLWQLVFVLVSIRDKDEGVLRETREEFATLLPPKRGKWRLGSGRWR